MQKGENAGNQHFILFPPPPPPPPLFFFFFFLGGGGGGGVGVFLPVILLTMHKFNIISVITANSLHSQNKHQLYSQSKLQF